MKSHWQQTSSWDSAQTQMSSGQSPRDCMEPFVGELCLVLAWHLTEDASHLERARERETGMAERLGSVAPGKMKRAACLFVRKRDVVTDITELSCCGEAVKDPFLLSAGAKRSNRLQLQQGRLVLGEDVLVKEDVWRGEQQGLWNCHHCRLRRADCSCICQE